MVLRAGMPWCFLTTFAWLLGYQSTPPGSGASVTGQVDQKPGGPSAVSLHLLSKTFRYHHPNEITPGTAFQLRDVPPGAYELSLHARGYYSVRVNFEVNSIPVNLPSVSLEKETLDCIRAPEFLRLPSPSGRSTVSVSGVVLQKYMRPVPDARLRFLLRSNGADAPRETSTGADGRYKIEVLPGIYSLQVAAQGFYEEEYASVTLVPGFDATLPAVRLTSRRPKEVEPVTVRQFSIPCDKILAEANRLLTDRRIELGNEEAGAGCFPLESDRITTAAARRVFTPIRALKSYAAEGPVWYILNGPVKLHGALLVSDIPEGCRVRLKFGFHSLGVTVGDGGELYYPSNRRLESEYLDALASRLRNNSRLVTGRP